MATLCNDFRASGSSKALAQNAVQIYGFGAHVRCMTSRNWPWVARKVAEGGAQSAIAWRHMRHMVALVACVMHVVARNVAEGGAKSAIAWLLKWHTVALVARVMHLVALRDPLHGAQSGRKWRISARQIQAMAKILTIVQGGDQLFISTLLCMHPD